MYPWQISMEALGVFEKLRSQGLREVRVSGIMIVELDRFF